MRYLITQVLKPLLIISPLAGQVLSKPTQEEGWLSDEELGGRFDYMSNSSFCGADTALREISSLT